MFYLTNFFVFFLCTMVLQSVAHLDDDSASVTTKLAKEESNKFAEQDKPLSYLEIMSSDENSNLIENIFGPKSDTKVTLFEQNKKKDHGTFNGYSDVPIEKSLSKERNHEEEHNLAILNLESDSCASQTTCTDCYTSTGCHWCGSDNACHAKASVYGCLDGASCTPNENSCAFQTDCLDCHHSSLGCHWCESDNTCHAKGSIYGCLNGSSCNATPPVNSCASHTDCAECYHSSLECHWCGSDNACHAKGSIYGCREGSYCNSTLPAEKSCASHTGCDECYHSSVGCHWCESDNACHARGSIYGCLEGSSCNATNSSCASHTGCEECYQSSVDCHWCGSDNACHAKGSIYGCLDGSYRNSTPKVDNACASHKSCSECSLSSSLCHWCGSDNACHARGSLYGCINGVNCYSNQRCQRQSPERVHKVFTAPAKAALACLMVGGLMICCLSLCFCTVGAIKGAFDDLTMLAANGGANDSSVIQENQTYVFESGQPRETQKERTRNYKYRSMEMTNVVSSSIFPSLDADASEEGGNNNRNNVSSNQAAHQNDDISSLTHSLLQNLPESTPEWAKQEEEHAIEEHPMMSRNNVTLSGPTKSRHAQCLFNCCKLTYIVSAVSIIALVIFAICYYPRKPNYNICSDQFDWNSIANGMTSLTMQGGFQILVSIYNPNKISVDLVQGSGSFKHKGVHVGNMEISPAKIEAESITDFSVTCTFTPDKWEALSLSTEYYRGKLQFLLDTSITVSFPELYGYTYNVKLADKLINVNEVSDRSLCACPQWSDVKPGLNQELVLLQ